MHQLADDTLPATTANHQTPRGQSLAGVTFDPPTPRLATRGRPPADPSTRLLAGPDGRTGGEDLVAHRERLGDVVAAPFRGTTLIDELDRSGLLGRGGAGFPVGRKWRSVAERSHGRAVLVANGAEGEPRSSKDRVLMALRPHLVLDGALLAAEAVGAPDITIYVGTEHGPAIAALRRAIAERGSWSAIDGHGEPPIALVEAPVGYVAGESSAVVHYLNSHDARPTSVPPRPNEQGVGNRPTVVQNVESLAHAALIARFGSEWYREAGHGATRGTALVTVSGPVADPGVREIEYGTTLAELVDLAGGATAEMQAVLLGGYFGGWAAIDDDMWDCPLDPAELAARGLGFGCGLVGLLPADACGVWATAQILDYMAGESARQCGPCIFGLGAIAEGMRRLASGKGANGDVASLARWGAQIVGRGACHHPDGAAALLQSALSVFGAEFALHEREHRCSRPARRGRGA